MKYNIQNFIEYWARRTNELYGRNPLRAEQSDGYEPPYNAEEIRRNYGEDTFQRLFKDPCHRWRMETGIELVHKEPTEAEFQRICRNWDLMSDEMKRLSDAKSVELFGVDNKTHAEELRREYSKERA